MQVISRSGCNCLDRSLLASSVQSVRASLACTPMKHICMHKFPPMERTLLDIRGPPILASSARLTSRASSFSPSSQYEIRRRRRKAQTTIDALACRHCIACIYAYYTAGLSRSSIVDLQTCEWRQVPKTNALDHHYVLA